ncbi:MAG: ATP synthase F1 subunit epsilon [Alkaliphilus sp.]
MATKFRLQVITPNRIFLDEEVEKAVIRTTQGDIAVLHDHIALVAPLKIGQFTVINSNNKRFATLAGGFIHVDLDKTVVITEAAEWQEEIDIERAVEAKKRAEERLEERRLEVDTLRAEMSLQRAMNRIDLAEKK